MRPGEYLTSIRQRFDGPAWSKRLSPLRIWVALGSFFLAMVLPVLPSRLIHFAIAVAIIGLFEVAIQASKRLKPHLPVKEPPPGPQRLPMAIAVPHRPSTTPTVVDPLKTQRSRTIDLRPKA